VKSAKDAATSHDGLPLVVGCEASTSDSDMSCVIPFVGNVKPTPSR